MRSGGEVRQAEIPTESINIGYRKALAQKYFKRQDYHASLTQWKVLQTIDPQNPEYANRIRVLDALIKRRIKLFLKRGKDQLGNDQLIKAEESLLMALALDPNNYFALKMMRRIEAKRVQRVQIAKTQKLLRKQRKQHAAEQKRLAALAASNGESDALDDENGHEDHESQEVIYLDMGKVLYSRGDWSGAIREINKYLTSNKSTSVIRSMLKTSHLNMSHLFEERGHWDPAIQHLSDAIVNANSKDEMSQLRLKRSELKLKAAENYYVEGVKVYRDNVSQAILFWQQALNHNPGHTKAKNRLKKAEQIQQKLKEIKQ